MLFDYFYGAQADQFAFYRIPKNLFTDPRFANLSSDARVLYGLMLDRMGLSAKNGWQDELRRVFIIFSIEEVCEAMRVSNKTACKYMSELDTVKGIGLIERVRLGQGQKSRIYVRNFITANEAPMQQRFTQEVETPLKELPAEKENEVKQSQQGKSPIFPATSKNYTSRSVKTTLLKNAPKTGDFQKCKNYTSRDVKTTLPEMNKVHAINNTEFSNNKLNNTMLPSSHIIQSINTGISMPAREGTTDLTAQRYETVRNDVAEQIEADTLKEEHGEIIDEIVELITDMMITPETSLRVAGADRPVEILRGQFSKLTAANVGTALWNLRKRASTEITDIKAYMRTLLYDTLFSMNTQIYHEATH